MTEQPPAVDLTTAVAAVRDQLTAAAEAAGDSPLRFEVGPITMEFAVEFTQDRSAKGGLKAWVLTAEAEARRATATTHRITFTLTPTTPTGPLDIHHPHPGDTRLFTPRRNDA
ncbi:trypco2 family protein [Phaeacidiphilus oryzae]|uniref:trypco2 family protein n=1 Tax=Phaeacidiphilus oryzae TaxID=348818 RepID=UPI00068DB295|nr:trypco2 family protein [Phaeacidiphilus oryzae]